MKLTLIVVVATLMASAACGGEAGYAPPPGAAPDGGTGEPAGECAPSADGCTCPAPNPAPNADCVTPAYMICPLGAANPDPAHCSPGLRGGTDRQAWCCDHEGP